ncbi:NAD(P)/FAD-dependent oxidoreductase [Dactylosporangium sp. NPDC005555]|uniref:dihydrolipoyl dehydrogenase family protein n=1 Tax=Dactylosporangium sp. NPDC005555 TaxID=3154889 RepID=UPI0033BC0A62
MAETVDVVVVGLGVGGEEVAGRLAEAGLRVVGVEGRLVGGECPYWGCVPSKMMIRAGNALAEARRVPELAGTADVTADWAPVARRVRDEATDSWDDKVAVDRLVGKGVTFVRGWARVTGRSEVTVGDRVFHATRGIVIGTGTEPAVPPIDGLADTPLWTNREAIEVATLPGALIVLGGGAIGVELAQVFARFGVAVTVVEAADRLVALEEPESSDVAQAALVRDGVTVHAGVSATSVRHDAGRFTVALADGRSVTAEQLLVATGRKVDLSKLGVEHLGLDASARSIAVDDRMRAADRVWAVGDVTGHGAFTHMAMYQAGIAIRDILGQDGPPADYRATPRVTFTDPEIGAVGLTEAQAREAGMSVRVGTAQVSSSSRGWIHKAGNEGFIKLVEDTSRGVLVGATSAGPAGGEVLSALTVAVHAAVPVETLRHMIYAYPTFHRGIEDALRDLRA